MDEQDEGITAYHGSPHDFEKFDTSKIGTGEGAQAYGHGLYFAEHEPVAEGYRDRLSGHHPGNVKIGDETHPHWAKKDVARAFAKLGYDPHTSVIAAHYIDEHQGNLEKASGALWQNENIPDSVHEALLKAEYSTPAGHMYEVHIKAHPDHFIDWDEPISDQHPDTWRKLVKGPAFISDAIKQGIIDNKTYGEVHGTIVAKHPRGQQGVSEHMAEMGIPGIKYLDAGSRGPTDKPTRNYVVFDHNHVAVKRKYEQGGRVGYDTGGVPLTPEEQQKKTLEVPQPKLPPITSGMDGTMAAAGPDISSTAMPAAANTSTNTADASTPSDGSKGGFGSMLGGFGSGLLGAAVGTAVAGPIGGLVGGMLGRGAYNSFSSTEDEQEGMLDEGAANAGMQGNSMGGMDGMGGEGGEGDSGGGGDSSGDSGGGGSGDGGGGGGDGGGEKRGGRIYPLRHHIDWEEAHDYEKTGGKLHYESPDHYLDQVKPLNMDHDDKHIIHHFEKQMKKGEKLDPVAIYPDGHPNGRHRAHAAKKLGIKKIPVIDWEKKKGGGSVAERALMVISKKV